MEIYDFLFDKGSFDRNDSYNGLLADYVSSHDDNFNNMFKQLININPETRIYKNYELSILHELVSNKKIGYRDIAKLPEGAVKIPYLIYWEHDDKQNCMMINTNSYIESRGMYYCMTEPGNTFEPFKFAVLAVYYNGKNSNDIIKSFTILQDDKAPNALVQRRLDDWNISDIDIMHDECVALAEDIFDNAIERLDGLSKEDKANAIYDMVARAFLLKKALYVRYMSNKQVINERHANNTVEARKFAKAYIEDIEIIPYYDLWNKQVDSQSEETVGNNELLME